MKLLFISNIPSPYQIEWAKKLRTKYDVEFWFMNDIANSKSKRPSYWNVTLPNYCKIINTIFKKSEFCFVPNLYKMLEKYNPDVINLGGSWHLIASYQAYLWAIKHRKKVIFSSMEFSQSMFSFFNILRNKFIYKFVYKNVDLFLANAFIHRDYLFLALNIKNVRIFMNYDNYAPYLKHSLRNKKIGHLTFMYGGSIDRRMRVPELLYVFEKINLEFKHSRLVIGGYGPEKDLCRKIVNSSNTLRNSVSFCDVKNWSEIPVVYKKSDVLINNASFSPGSGVILSALASGMGIISSVNIHSSRHFLNDRLNGFFVEDDSDLYFAMKLYLTDSKLLKKHSIFNKNLSKKLLSLDYHLECYSKILTQFL